MRRIQQLTDHVFIFPFNKKSFILLIRVPPTQSTYNPIKQEVETKDMGSDSWFFLFYPMIFPYTSMQICMARMACRLPSAW